jgi:hypothetical protein
MYFLYIIIKEMVKILKGYLFCKSLINEVNCLKNRNTVLQRDERTEDAIEFY